MKPSFLVSAALFAMMTSSAHAATNLVVNGDFSQGNFGFTSGYRYVAPTPDAMMPETVYTVAADPHSVHPYWIQLTENKPLLLVNGATSSGVTVWQENLATTAGQIYNFSASAANVCCNSAHPGQYAPSELVFEVSSNNFSTFQTLATIDTHPSGDAGEFYTVTDTFTAAGPLEIRLVDALTGRVGNDFALADISVTADGEPAGGISNPSSPGTNPGTSGSQPISAVPEVGTWALMLAGFWSVGAAIRSRRKQALATT